MQKTCKASGHRMHDCLAHLYQVVLSVGIVRTKFGFEYLVLIICGLVPWVNRQHCFLNTSHGFSTMWLSF